MSIPVGYSMTGSGLWQNSADNSMGYSIDIAGTPTFLGGTLAYGAPGFYYQGPTGYHYGPDGDGPYLRNSAGQLYTPGF